MQVEDWFRLSDEGRKAANRKCIELCRRHYSEIGEKEKNPEVIDNYYVFLKFVKFEDYSTSIKV